MNKILQTMLFLIFGLNIAFSQDTTKASRPWLTLTSAQQRQEMLIKRISDYSYIIGRNFGKFSVVNKDGSVVLNKDSLAGKVVFVNFWFDGCAYCHNLFEPLNRLHDHFKDDPRFKVVSFTFDNREMLQRNVEKYGLLYPVFHLSNQECHFLMTDKGFPSNLLLDKTGKIIDGFGAPKLEEVIGKIDSLLNVK